MASFPRVLVALDKDGVAARDEEPRRRVAEQVEVQVGGRALGSSSWMTGSDAARLSGDGALARRTVRPSNTRSRWLWEPTRKGMRKKVVRSPIG